MKQWLIVISTFAFLVGFVGLGNVYAQFGNKVADTPHNLREATETPMPLTDYGEICVYCHTPHNNNTDIDAPLWNRSTPTGPYTMYSSTSLDMDIATSPQGVSLACLSCHDNTIALDQIINIPPSALGSTASGTTIENCGTQCHVGDTPSGGLNFEGTNIGTNLGNDHPISITYDPSKDPNFLTASNGKVGNLPLYGPSQDQVECASCHNPHDNSNEPFLRISNENSAMCLTCHDI
jgi:predicted CXXCH cytochrome family protein